MGLAEGWSACDPCAWAAGAPTYLGGPTYLKQAQGVSSWQCWSLRLAVKLVAVLLLPFVTVRCGSEVRLRALTPRFVAVAAGLACPQSPALAWLSTLPLLGGVPDCGRP